MAEGVNKARFDFLNESVPESKSKLSDVWIINKWIDTAVFLYANIPADQMNADRFIAVVDSIQGMIYPILSNEVRIFLYNSENGKNEFISGIPRMDSAGNHLSDYQIEQRLKPMLVRFSKQKFDMFIREMSRHKMSLYKRIISYESGGAQTYE